MDGVFSILLIGLCSAETEEKRGEHKFVNISFARRNTAVDVLKTFLSEINKAHIVGYMQKPGPLRVKNNSVGSAVSGES